VRELHNNLVRRQSLQQEPSATLWNGNGEHSFASETVETFRAWLCKLAATTID